MLRNFNPLNRFFPPSKPLPAGMYHYQSPPDDPRNYRLHLRLEEDGGGVLVVNASTILHLNQTAAEYAYYLVHNTSPEEVARKMKSHYRVSLDEAKNDYLRFTEQVLTLIETPDLDPITFLGFERQMPFSGHIRAPYRLDCAITYLTRQSSEGQVSPQERVKRELTTQEWQAIFEKAWKAGIPQIVFTGGEPTLRPDVTDLIGYCENLGQISGLITDGLSLLEKAYLQSLLVTGLDFLMLIYQPDEDTSWKILDNCLAEDIFVAVHLTLNENNLSQIKSILPEMSARGVKGISISAASPSLKPTALQVRQWIADHGLDLIWNLPVPYSNLHPVALELEGVDVPEGAGKAWLYIEPDGDVLPAQGVLTRLGNMLEDPWETIWKASA